MSSTRLGLVALLALVVGVFFSCTKQNKPVGPPSPPPNAPSDVAITQVTNTTVTLQWHDNSTDEDGFRVYVAMDSSTTGIAMDSVATNVTHTTVDSLVPGTTYYFTVAAFNQDGESAKVRSYPWHVQTQGTTVPNPPTNVSATPSEMSIVVITWQSAGAQDSFLVQRHDTANAQWLQVGATAGTIVTFTDSSVAAATHYYYRVGAKNAYTTSWSLDSASVVTLAPGAPAAPDSLQAQVVIGTGVTLTWINVSHNATGIVIFRQPYQQNWMELDTLPATSTTFTDSLGTAFGLYFYELRAFNTFGNSPYSASVTADYRLRSPGVIPLAFGNYWIYDVTDTAGSPRLEQRIVSDVVFFGGQDFYLMTANPSGAPADSMFYLRNDSLARGCMMLHWPLTQSDHPQLLFKYPDYQSDTVYVDGRIVQVVGPLPGQQLNVNGTVYNGVITYEWFISPNYRVIYYIEPNTVGIIREVHYTGPIGSPVLSKTLNLRTYNAG